MAFQIELADDAATRVPCAAEQTVLAALSGVGDRRVQVGCRNGGCGVCRVQVLSGEYECGQMSAAQVSESDRARGVVLACRVQPRSDLCIRPLGLARCNDTQAAALFRRLTAGIAA